MRTRLRVVLVARLVVVMGLLAACPAALGAKPSKTERVNKYILQLFSKDKDTRIGAVESLGWAGGDQAMGALGKVLRTGDQGMRGAAIKALALADAEGAKVLAAYLGESGTDAGWRLRVVAVVGGTGDPDGLAVLRIAVRDADPRVRAKAISATVWLVESMILDAKHKTKDRAKAVATVFERAGKGPLAMIVAATKDRSPKVRAAALTLAMLVPERSAPVLEALKFDSDPTVRAAATWALDRRNGAHLALADKTVVAKLKKKPPSLDFGHVPLELLIQFIREVCGVSVHVNWRALADKGVDKTTEMTHMSDESIARALDTVLFSAGGPDVSWFVEGKVIYITTTPGVRRLLENPVRPITSKGDKAPKATEAILARCKQKLPQVEFVEAPIGQCVEFIREVADVSIYVRWDALKAAEVDPETPCNVHVKDIPVMRVLAMMFDDVAGWRRCAYMVCGGTVIVTTSGDLWELTEAKRPEGLGLVESLMLTELKAHLRGPRKDRSNGQRPNPVEWMARKGQVKMLANVLARIDAKPRVRACNDVLAVAAEKGHVKLVEYLLDQGAEIERGSSWGNALHHAAFYARPEVVSLLIARGADVNAPSSEGTPLARVQQALAHEQKQLAASAKEYRGPHETRIAGLKKVIEILRKHGGKVEVEKTDRKSRD